MTSAVAVREAYGQWLGQQPFDAFLTITHDAEGTLTRRPRRLLTDESRIWRQPRRCHPEQLVKRFYYARALFNAARYGRDWRKDDRHAMSAVLGVERHLSHSAHGHALLRVPGGIDFDELRYWQRAFTDTGGFCKLEIPRSQQDTMDYVCKYVCKDDALDFTPNFEPTTREPSLPLATATGSPPVAYSVQSTRTRAPVAAVPGDPTARSGAGRRAGPSQADWSFIDATAGPCWPPAP